MQSQSFNRDTNLVWVDLEMTGLNADHDVILEIATIITDSQLTVIAQGPQLVIHHSADVLAGMHDVVRKLHTQSGLLDAVRDSVVTTEQATEQTLEFIREYCNPHTALLCGNSVWQDRNFLKKHMPAIIDFLHYRMIDVSTVKEIVRRWYGEEYKKPSMHRALKDIEGSIEELGYYRKKFFVGDSNNY